MQTTLPALWKGSDVFIIGGGPSINNQDLSLIHSKRVIGVNNAYLLGDWVDACWFGDCKWYNWHRKRLQLYNGIVAHTCPSGQKKGLPGFHFYARDRKKHYGITVKLKHISWNNNSGISAINFAYHMGAKRIILLGFDMCDSPTGQTHYHGGHTEQIRTAKYKQNKRKNVRPYPRFLTAFPTVAKDAKTLGLEIINTSMDSVITEFPKQLLEEVV